MKKMLLTIVCLLVISSVTGFAFAAEKVTVEFWHPYAGEDGDLLNELVADFNGTVGQEKGVEIHATFVARSGQMFEKLLTAIAGGTPPDIAYFDRFLVTSWAARNSLVDLTAMAQRDGITSDMFYPFAWDESSYNGHLYAMPHDTDARALFYNKQLFREAGLDPEKAPTTIEDLDTMAEKLTVMKDGSIARMGFIPWFSQGFFTTWGHAFGGQFYDAQKGEVTLTDSRLVDALKWEVGYADKYGSATIDSFSDSFGAQAFDPFLTGDIAMRVDGNWSITNIEKYSPDLDYGIAPTPYPSDGGMPNSTWAGGWALIIPKGSKHTEEAWEFLKWIGQEEAQLKHALASNRFPVNKAAGSSPALLENPKQAVFVNLLPTAFNRPAIPEGSLLWQELKQVVQSARFHQKSPEQALKEANDKVNRALSRWK